jgi:hypothetical protein
MAGSEASSQSITDVSDGIGKAPVACEDGFKFGQACVCRQHCEARRKDSSQPETPSEHGRLI